MSKIFISHSSKDDACAIKLRDWLIENGWNDIFLDLDPMRGLVPGTKWQEQLRLAAHRCEAIILMISYDWLTSPWCRAEAHTAYLLGKRVFPLMIGDVQLSEVPAEFQSEQIINLTQDKNAYQRLKNGLTQAGFEASTFTFRPGRRPYPGLEPLVEEDAAIFYGREANIISGVDHLRRLRNRNVERFFVILGASGAGKSSFLRAGLIPRLKRDNNNFFVLPVVRPERSVITGEYGLVNALESVLNEITLRPTARAGVGGRQYSRSQ